MNQLNPIQIEQIIILGVNHYYTSIALSINRSSSRPNTRSNIEVAKLQIFNKEISKVSEFLILYKLYKKKI